MTLGRMQNPVRGLVHGGAAVAALVGTVYLVHRTWGNTAALLASLIFGVALAAMYTVSSLYHSIRGVPPGSDGCSGSTTR
jgi:channel protein (hemolysin III family)